MKRIISFIRTHPDLTLLALALLTLVTAFVRVGGGRAIAAVTAPTLVFTQWWQDELEEGTLENLISEFESLHPEIKIELRRLAYEELKERLFSVPADGSPAEAPGDILALDPLWSAGLERREILESPAPSVLGYFCPLFYNIEILKAAGFSMPPKTRNEFLSYAKKVTRPDAGVYAIALALSPGDSRGIYRDVYSWIWTVPGVPLMQDGKSALTSPEIRETLDFLSALARENLIYPSPFELGEEEKQEAFINGRTAFIIAPVQNIEIFRRRMGEAAFSFTAIPGPESYSGKPGFGAFGWSLGISRQSRYKEEAGAFVSFLLGKSAYLAEQLGAVPGNGSNPPPAAQKDPFYSKAWDLYIAGEFIQEFSELEEAEETEKAFRQELGLLLTGEE
jgi:multiple sugar transport system substrate-binding protein